VPAYFYLLPSDFCLCTWHLFRYWIEAALA
jgi:hypothetical protein